MKTLRRIGMPVLTVAAFAVTLLFCAQPAKANRPVYSAGIANGPICACPVMVGSCVCQIGT